MGDQALDETVAISEIARREKARSAGRIESVRVVDGARDQFDGIAALFKREAVAAGKLLAQGVEPALVIFVGG